MHILPLNDIAEIIIRTLLSRILAFLKVEHWVRLSSVRDRRASLLDLLTSDENLIVEFFVREHFSLGLSQQILDVLSVRLTVDCDTLILRSVGPFSAKVSHRPSDAKLRRVHDEVLSACASTSHHAL